MAVSTLGTPTSNSGHSFFNQPNCSHTIAAGSNVVTYIFVYASNEVTLSSPSFAGQTPTLINTPLAGLHIYRVVSPSAGATSFTCTASDDALWSVFVYSLQGVDTADPDDIILTNNDNADPVVPLTVTVSTVTGERALAFGLVIGSNIGPHTGSTQLLEAESIDTAFQSTILVYQDGNGSVTPGFTSTDSCCDSYIIGFNVNAAGTGAAYTITCDQGSYGLTGRDAGLVKQTPSLNAESGSYTLIGSDAYREIQVNMEFATYTLTGQDVDLVTPIENLVLVAEMGLYELQGSEGFRDIYINMEGGSYSLNGQDVRLSRDYRVVLEQALYTMDGFAAGLIWDGQPDAPPARAIMRRRFFGYRLGR